MSFDIAQFDSRSRSEAGVPFHVLHPKSGAPFLDDKKNPITITLLGRNSDAFRIVQRAAQQRDADRQAHAIVKTDEDFENERIDTLIAMTRGWTFDTLDGAKFPFNAANCRKLWTDGRWMWLRGQMMANILQEGNFLALKPADSSGGQNTSSD